MAGPLSFVASRLRTRIHRREYRPAATIAVLSDEMCQLQAPGAHGRGVVFARFVIRHGLLGQAGRLLIPPDNPGHLTFEATDFERPRARILLGALFCGDDGSNLATSATRWPSSQRIASWKTRVPWPALLALSLRVG